MMRSLGLLIFVLSIRCAVGQLPSSPVSVFFSLDRSTYLGDLGSGFLDLTQDFNLGMQLGLEYQQSRSYSIGFFHQRGRLSYDQDFVHDHLPSFKSKFRGHRLQGRYHLHNGKILPLGTDLRLSIPHFVGVNRYISEDEGGESHFSFGAGLQANLPLDDHWELSYAVLHHWAMTPDMEGKFVSQSQTNDRFLTHSLGVSYKLKSVKDSDGDGILDSEDKCPLSIGTSSMGGCPDSDFDGISDLEDDCIFAAGPLSSNGCPDTDGDGSIDSEDECPDLFGLAANEGCPDSDGDGVIDCNDDCPDEPGGRDTRGCPDMDGDGIADIEDDCPRSAGIAEFGGCPDTDRDGIPDSKDKCPNVYGIATTEGCPDSDGDGVIDSRDRCPQEYGLTANDGCPEEEYFHLEELDAIARKIKFNGLSSKLNRSSYSSLRKLVLFLDENPNYKLRIVGHMASDADEELNMIYSLERAGAVKEYLVSKGVDERRINAVGLGETMSQKPSRQSLSTMFSDRRVELLVALL